MSGTPTDAHPKQVRESFGALRRWFGARRAAERCDLCGSDLTAEHDHLLFLPDRRLLCACNACAILAPKSQESPYRRIPDEVRFVPDFRMSEGQWDRFQIPIDLAFFFFSSLTGKVSVGYPSPAGLIEAIVDQEAWASVLADNPALQNMKPDTEALLINRLNRMTEYFLLPVDHCYRLVGLMRSRWQGLSGGPEAQKEIERFFSQLKEQTHA